MKAHVDKETCIGCELCPNICPEVFRMEDDGLAVAIDVEVPSDNEDTAKEAEEACPVDAIEVS
ncbi:ferredoxin [Natranaerovirga hydrolytica]|uniref:Ferredoxin n=1 Tax=Natranaerovirga hydrolytica TaxID=680378 RepID=A0A4R1MEG7_9FIRM|nr:ferredoxin [Natranaerovirga hydrolytica]TCK90517.1 ferredoxin [Natranaerovirga hydrolytica]